MRTDAVMKKKRKITATDTVFGALLLAAVAYMVYRVTVGLNYKWKWEVIPQYLMRYDSAAGSWVPNYLLQGLFTTLRLSFWGTVLATLFGTLMGLFRVSRRLFYRLLGRTYVELIRNLPPLVIIFIFYFFLSDQIMPFLDLDCLVRAAPPAVQRIVAIVFATPQNMAPFLSAVLTLAIFEGAYIAEIVRAGIESVEPHQWEAAHALGLSGWQTMRHVILPQALQRLLPALAGQFISLVKDSAIVSVISVQELTFQGTQLMASTYMTIEIWTTVTLLYLVITLTCSLAVGKLETYMARSHT